MTSKHTQEDVAGSLGKAVKAESSELAATQPIDMSELLGHEPHEPRGVLYNNRTIGK